MLTMQYLSVQVPALSGNRMYIEVYDVLVRHVYIFMCSCRSVDFSFTPTTRVNYTRDSLGSERILIARQIEKL